jgi:hypothetical protein
LVGQKGKAIKAIITAIICWDVTSRNAKSALAAAGQWAPAFALRGVSGVGR